MDTEVQKVFVALGNDLQDGYKTLDWTLGKWKSQPISIIILHVPYNISCQDFVYTPFGKLPATSVSDEKLEILKMYEQGKTDNLLSKYIAYCGKVRAEVLKVEKYDEPIHKIILDLISGLKITKLVLGLSFMKSTPGKSRTAISGSYYVHQEKPDYCKMFIICGGKLVFLKGGENDEGIMEDDRGVAVAKMKEMAHFTSWWTKMFPEIGRNPPRFSISSNCPHDSSDSQNRWEFCIDEIENYFQHLVSLNLDEENSPEEDQILQTCPAEHTDCNMSVAEKMESMKSQINEAREMIQLKKKEMKDNAERCAKAQWAICLCDTRADQLETVIKEEATHRMEIQKDLESEKEQLYEVIRDVEESKNRLSSLTELQSEFSIKLRSSTMAKGHAEAQLEKSVIARADMVRDIEELRRQRDVLNRRIEFCKEKDAIGMVTRSNKLSHGYREYTAEDIRVATEDFSDRFRLKCGGEWTNVYRGRLNYANVAIKVLNNGLSEEDFQAKVNFLSEIRHPHLVAMMGFCSKLKCIILEYMHNGNLRDMLFTSPRGNHKCRQAIRWPNRIRIAHEVCLGLSFLHSAEPTPIVHGNLTPSNILLDRNLVAKISGFGLNVCDQQAVGSDIRAFGLLVLHLLTGRTWAGLDDEAKALALDRTALVRVLDENAGKWPLDLAGELAGISTKCLSANKDLRIASVMQELVEVRKRADGLVGKRESEVVIDVPSVFLCPIFQEVMKNPHLAADGFSYELEAMEEWLEMGHDTSPMTNLRLKHKYLTPNHTLRSLIQEWHNKQSGVQNNPQC